MSSSDRWNEHDSNEHDSVEPLPSAALLAAVSDVADTWLLSLVARVVSPHEVSERDRDEVETIAGQLVAEMEVLLAADVERQRENPLGVMRRATERLTEHLRAAGHRATDRDPFERERFPDDVYSLIPSGWQEIDPSLAPLGLRWGAWKAAVILARRRGSTSAT